MRRLLKDLLIQLLLSLSGLLNRWAMRLLDCTDSGCVTLRLRYSFLPGSFFTSDGVITMRLTNEQFVTVAPDPRTAAGNPAPLDGEPTFVSSDESVIRAERQEDGTFRVIAVGPGFAQLNATADADMDEGEVREIHASDVFEVVAAEAETFGFTYGEPQLQ